MDISLGNYISVRGRPSVFHANFTRILEMCASDFLGYLEEVADKNPCVEPYESCETIVVHDGEVSVSKDIEFQAFDSPRTGTSHRADLTSEEEGLDPPGSWDDFSDSLPVYLSSQIPSCMEKGSGEIFRNIIQYIDDRGFLGEDPGVIADLIGASVEEVLGVLDVIKCFDPGGIGSRDVKDFLWYQCRDSGSDTFIMESIINDYLDDIAAGNLDRVRRDLDLSQESLRKILETLRNLRPYPTWGMEFTPSHLGPPGQTMHPDLVFFLLASGDCVLQVLEPSMRLQMISPCNGEGACAEKDDDGANLEWLKKVKAFEREANNLYELACKRKTTIISVASLILETQKAYLTGERDYKEPLTISQVAKELGQSVSTISRVVKGRVISTPRGTFPLKGLFSPLFQGSDGEHLSQDYIVHQIRDIAKRSDGRSRSDQEIAEILRSEGIDIARRTVNKYRKLL